MSHYDQSFKILLLGDSSVGKTSLLIRYIDGVFGDSHIATIGIDYKVKFVSLNDKKIKLNLWDTAGQERFRALAKNYFKGANGFIFVYDITNRKSFDSVKKWVSEAQQMSVVKNFQMFIAGNKVDCEDERVVEQKELIDLAKKYGAHHIETSAKDNINVDDMFNTLITGLSENYVPPKEDLEDSTKIDSKSFLKDNKEGCHC